jgi:hypothetical protein
VHAGKSYVHGETCFMRAGWRCPARLTNLGRVEKSVGHVHVAIAHVVTRDGHVVTRFVLIADG